MRIRKKLLLGYGVMVFFVLVIGFAAYVQMDTMQEEFSTFDDHLVGQISTFSRFKDNIHMAIVNSHAYVITEQDKYKRMTGMMLNESQAWEKRYKNVLNPEFADAITQRREATAAEVQALMRLVEQDASEQRIQEQVNQLGTVRGNAMNFYHGEVDEHFQDTRGEATADVRDTFSTFLTVLVVLTVLSVLVAGGIGFYIGRSISQPLQELTETIESISKGDLDVEIASELKRSDDEIGELARAFERTLASLKLAMRESGAMEEGEGDAEDTGE